MPTLSDTGGNHDLQFFDEEAVDLYDDMLLEAADSINYEDFLDKLKNLDPKEVLETNYFESVGSDIEPVVPLHFEEPDLEWVKIKETEELPEDLDDENEGRNEKEVEIDNIEKQKEEDNEKEADEEDDTRSGSSHETTDSEETTSPSELQDDRRKETELAPWDPSNNETEEKIESFSDVLVESGSVIDYVEFKEKLKELEKRDLQPTAEEPLEDTDQIKAVLFPEIEEPVTEWWHLVDDDLEQDDVKSLNEVPKDSIFTEGENEGFYGLDQKSGGKPDNSEKEDFTPDHSETTSRDSDPKNLDADKPESEETPSKVITSAGNNPINEDFFDTSADVGKKIPEFADDEMQVMERMDPELDDSCRDLDNERAKPFATSSGMVFAMVLQDDVVLNKEAIQCDEEVNDVSGNEKAEIVKPYFETETHCSDDAVAQTATNRAEPVICEDSELQNLAAFEKEHSQHPSEFKVDPETTSGENEMHLAVSQVDPKEKEREEIDDLTQQMPQYDDEKLVAEIKEPQLRNDDESIYDKVIDQPCNHIDPIVEYGTEEEVSQDVSPNEDKETALETEETISEKYDAELDQPINNVIPLEEEARDKEHVDVNIDEPLESAQLSPKKSEDTAEDNNVDIVTSKVDQVCDAGDDKETLEGTILWKNSSFL